MDKTQYATMQNLYATMRDNKKIIITINIITRLNYVTCSDIDKLYVDILVLHEGCRIYSLNAWWQKGILSDFS